MVDALTEPQSTPTLKVENPPQEVADTPLGRGWLRRCQDCGYWQVDTHSPIGSRIHYCWREGKTKLYLVQWEA